jgi:hypothetical protein
MCGLALEGRLRFRQIPDLADRSASGRNDRGFVAVNRFASADELL